MKNAHISAVASISCVVTPSGLRSTSVPGQVWPAADFTAPKQEFLDPNQTFQVRDLILSLAKTKTILLSTHILTEVKAVCSRVILINGGRLILDGTVEEMEGKQHDMEQQFRSLTGGPA